MGSKYTGEPTTAAGRFHEEASRTTDAAVAEGKQDFEQVKAVGAGYVEQAKNLTNIAVETAQGYLPTAMGGKPDNGPAASEARSKSDTGVVESVRATATSAYTAAKEAVQPHIEKIQGATQEYLGAAGGTEASAAAEPMPASSTGIPATSAPLESGPHTVDTPYPSKADKVSGSDIAASAPPTSRN
ncbi:hypothetical protein M413DRAFT_439434 [Hebeloma cylindrosporum]|uniref:Uncharacterized protein n=1 Tax=Hebeloma cylindrosporum TaxID=76867 RepID=A0A0C3CUH1_HEBCY|nr:hypothetical protein M413DRAFT_439434 [Hebeloma cylindrosporum h7]